MRDFSNVSVEDFDVWTLVQFNRLCDTNIKQGDSFETIGQVLDDEDISYFYVSMCSEDVIEALKNEPDIAEMLDVRLIHVPEISLFIATY